MNELQNAIDADLYKFGFNDAARQYAVKQFNDDKKLYMFFTFNKELSITIAQHIALAYSTGHLDGKIRLSERISEIMDGVK